MADRVRVYEVGPRDGLQNEAASIDVDTKLRYIELLARPDIVIKRGTRYK